MAGQETQYTRCRHNETGHEAEIPTEALDAWSRLGWESIGDSRSQNEAEQERIDAENASADLQVEVAEELAAPKPPKVSEVLAQVGDDPEAAQAALDAEQARENPRTTLVDGLQKIIDAATGGENQEG